MVPNFIVAYGLGITKMRPAIAVHLCLWVKQLRLDVQDWGGWCGPLETGRCRVPGNWESGEHMSEWNGKKMHSNLVIGVGTLAALSLIASSAQAVQIFAIDDEPGQRLLGFDSSNPTDLNTAVAINGLQPNEKLIGIDFRNTAGPAASQGLLYGVGSFGRIYTINTATGAASFVSQIAVTLNGTEFGVDFNPNVNTSTTVPADPAGPFTDRLRVVSDLGQNLRINVDTGATVVDGAINPSSANITAAAYLNPDTNTATGTTLYTIDTVANTLNIQFPPNNGTQAVVGNLGVNPNSTNGFDIDQTGLGYAGFEFAGSSLSSVLYTINLATGMASPLGSIGNAEDEIVIRGLAVVPEPATLSLAGLALLGLAGRRRRA